MNININWSVLMKIGYPLFPPVFIIRIWIPGNINCWSVKRYLADEPDETLVSAAEKIWNGEELSEDEEAAAAAALYEL